MIEVILVFSSEKFKTSQNIVLQYVQTKYSTDEFLDDHTWGGGEVPSPLTIINLSYLITNHFD